ncbi:MAG: ATP-binding protein [Prevotellaceae bacterium]|nr:ATP-binding protein [Candidatus Minthosoma equi]
MNRIVNPFIVYGYVSPEYFCDRKEETSNLISALRNGRNVTLMSPRRMGKTGLIHNAFHHIEEEYPDAACFYMDIFSTNSLKDFVMLFGKTVLGKVDTIPQKAMSAVNTFLKSCRVMFSVDELSGMPTASLDFQPHEAEATLNEIFNYLKHSERECFIAIDEFQQIAEYEEEFEGKSEHSKIEALLRSYIQFCPNLHFIFSGSKSHMMSDIFDKPNRPFYRSTEKMHLYTIPEESYYTFASEWMNKADVAMSEEIFHQIYERFEGHTWYVQYVLNKIYEQQPEQVEASLVTNCIGNIVKSNTEDYQRLCHQLTKNQYAVLKAIAKEHRVTSINGSAFLTKYQLKGSSSVNKAVKSLIDNEYIFNHNGTYQVYDRFMELWLRQQAS